MKTHYRANARIDNTAPDDDTVAPTLECGDLSPLLPGDSSPSNCRNCFHSFKTSGVERTLAGRQVGQRLKRRRVAALQGLAALAALLILHSATLAQEPKAPSPFEGV